MQPVDIFHIGPQKAASTWVYGCLDEHPEVACPPQLDIFYFDMFYHRGRSWYEEWFRGARPGQKLIDPTNTYIRCAWAAERIARENPAARIVLCMRHPIERAFSHYWHEKRRGRNYEFEEVLTNYDLYSSWLEPGFYARHIARFLNHFPKEQILAQLYDGLKSDPAGFLHELLTFIGVDTDFRPSVLTRRANEAGPRRDPLNRNLERVRKGLERAGIPLGSLGSRMGGKTEYLRGIDPDLRRRLDEICAPEIDDLERLLGIDLSAWRSETEASSAQPALSNAG